MIGGISPVGIGSGFYYQPTPGLFNSQFNNADSTIGGGAAVNLLGTDQGEAIDKTGKAENDPLAKATGKVECETCKNRKYQDGSDENVSFKSPGKISPGESASRVRAHEQEHVANAFTKAADKGGKVLQASVALKTAICPECGRSYVAGGTTTTKISYPKDNYGQNRKSYDKGTLTGANVDTTA